jgi:hypothetical protein
MRKSTLAMVVALGSVIGLPALAQQQTVPNSQMKQMQEDADKGATTRQSGESGYVGLEEKPGASAHPPGQADTVNSEMKRMQEEADKGAKTRQSGESGYVGLEETPGASAHPPGRADTAPPPQTTGEATRDPTVREMNVKEKDKVEKTGK